MSLKNQLTEDMKAAMKGGDKERLGLIRPVNAAIKQRRDSIQQFEAAGRNDLADKEKFEVGVIQHYLPAQLSAAEVDAIIAASISEAGAAGPKDMGKVMGLVKPKVAGRTDMGKLSELVKAKL